MATDDLTDKNAADKKPDKANNEDEIKDKDDVSESADNKVTPGEKESGNTPIAVDIGNAAGDTNTKITNLTPEEIEEESIDEEETEFSPGDCMCMEQDGDFYCFKLKQGRWIQWSVIPYPTKKICEAACCNT